MIKYEDQKLYNACLKEDSLTYQIGYRLLVC